MPCVPPSWAAVGRMRLGLPSPSDLGRGQAVAGAGALAARVCQRRPVMGSSRVVLVS